MNIDDLPTFSHLSRNMVGFKYIFKIYSFFRVFGLKSKKIDEMKEKFDDLCSKLNEYRNYVTKFNKYFSEDGWIVYDSLNYDIIKNAVEKHEREGKDEAKKLLLDYFSPENVEKMLFFLKSCKELRERYRFIEYALEDYKAKRYYSTIPLLLMVIDGAVSDTIQKGFHAKNIDLNVWDAITSVDGGIDTVKKIFQKSRKKTTTESITLPYRHGILHGRDLSYDTYEVAAKAWCFLFIVSDWIKSKSSEHRRKEKFIKETRIPPLKELLDKLVEVQKIKEKMAEWSPRNIDEQYIKSINSGTTVDSSLPEYTAIEYCNLWCKKNYGYMSNLYSLPWKQQPKELREQYDWLDVNSFQILSINDDAPAISEILVKIYLKDSNSKECKLRLIYENKAGDALPRNVEGGSWKIILCNII